MKKQTKTPSLRWRAVWIEITYFLLIVLFVVAGGSKLLDHKKFVGEMLNQVFPHWFSWALIYTLPWYELLIVLSILIGVVFNSERLRKMALVNSCVLMSAFLLYSILALSGIFGRVPCSCGGIIEKLHWPQHVALNAFYVLITFVSIRLLKRQKVREESKGAQTFGPVITT